MKHTVPISIMLASRSGGMLQVTLTHTCLTSSTVSSLYMHRILDLTSVGQRSLANTLEEVQGLVTDKSLCWHGAVTARVLFFNDIHLHANLCSKVSQPVHPPHTEIYPALYVCLFLVVPIAHCTTCPHADTLALFLHL